MEQLHHPNIIRLYEVIDTMSRLHMVMEYASGGELFRTISEQGKLSDARAKHYFKQVLSAVEHMVSGFIVSCVLWERIARRALLHRTSGSWLGFDSCTRRAPVICILWFVVQVTLTTDDKIAAVHGLLTSRTSIQPTALLQHHSSRPESRKRVHREVKLGESWRFWVQHSFDQRQHSEHVLRVSTLRSPWAVQGRTLCRSLRRHLGFGDPAVFHGLWGDAISSGNSRQTQEKHLGRLVPDDQFCLGRGSVSDRKHPDASSDRPILDRRH